MLLLKLISPKQLPRKKADWKFHHKFYKAILELYLRLYSKGVIEDRIVVNEVVAIHTLCDVWFEKELRRFDIKIAPSLGSTPMKSFKKRKYHRYRTFNWVDKFTVIHCGKDCCVTRDNTVCFDTDMVGQLQTSSDSDSILSVSFNGYHKSEKRTETKSEREAQPYEEPKKTQTPVSQPKKKKIHIKDTVTPRQETPRVEKNRENQPEETYTKHKGFEENDIF